ncbi:hypothetical protein [Bacillus sp. FJAT-26390]|uniref:hypothetical protein n=1 Tax=Bacillus sp. FJAT-26390 TaxID=1743142 RepID=UPI000807FF20|nr:hypothetical protein [Bacillus sp. FJAT-26390]OBZ10926.1 hypothetical protein A7975_18180 [Bacillus sp. FJAT-26390]
MPKVYIINTNKTHNPNDEPLMLQNEKCAAYYTPWKYYIDTIEANDIVYLYSNDTGIIARGIATGIVETADYNGDVNEEHYMNLNRFERLATPLRADELTSVIRSVAGNDYKIQWNQTMILVAYPFGLKVWQYITKNCI